MFYFANMVLITFVGVLVAPLIVAHNVIRKSDLQISYHGSKKNTCDIEEYRFQAIMNSKLSDCVIECALREHCAVMNYRPDYKLCELHQINVRTSNLTGNCFRVEREDIHITQSPCGEMPCPNGTACDRKTATCQVKECLEIPRLNNGIVRGNLRAVGNRIKYECDDGYHLTDSLHEVAECLENGTWSTRDECVTDYIAPSDVGKLCDGINCQDPNTECIEKYSNEEYCHCIFGFEFDQTLNMCIEACTGYSTNPTDFVGQSNLGISGYNLNSGYDISSPAECITYCSNNYPQYLAAEVYQSGTRCGCSTISEEQQIVAHDALVPTSGCTFYNRPCAIPA